MTTETDEMAAAVRRNWQNRTIDRNRIWLAFQIVVGGRGEMSPSRSANVDPFLDMLTG